MPGRLLGRVVRLQVQRSPLKPGAAVTRSYDPGPITEVAALELTPRGVVGVDRHGGRVLDVHNAAHPQTRDRKGRAGVSLMSRADYAALRARFGGHLVDGCGGETLLLDTEEPLAGREFPVGLLLESAGGVPVALERVRVAAPCVEFARFCLGREPGTLDAGVLGAMAELDGGARGYRAVAGSWARVVPGARVWAPAVPAARAPDGLVVAAG